MNIGLIFPNKDRRYKTVHLGLAYITAYARDQHEDLNIQFLDTRVASSKETRKFFNSTYDLIGITVFAPVYFEVIDVFNSLRKTHNNVPICLGGPYVTTIMEEIFEKTPSDFAVYGEGEITFSELIFNLKGKRVLRDINGLIYKNEQGKIITNPAREHIKDLNQIPFPAYDILPMKKYPLHRMATSRGCPFSCAWCNCSSIWNKTFRARSAENIIDEIEFLIKNYGKKIFVFGDNSFNIDLKRVEAFCDLIIKKKIKILWSASIRADIMSQDIAYKMKEAGCYNASIGIESANNFILSNMGKSTTIEKMEDGIRMLKNAGIEVMSQFVIGSPQETLKTVKESIEFAKKSGCDFTNFYSVLPVKGTSQWDYVLKNGKFFSTEIHKFRSINPRIVFETPEFPYKDRLEAIRLVKKEGFYSHRDKKSWWFDFAKDIAEIIQRFLPESLGEKLYRLLKFIYSFKIIKKNNI